MNRQKKTWAKKESRIQDRSLSSVDIHRIWFPIRKISQLFQQFCPMIRAGTNPVLRAYDRQITCLHYYMFSCLGVYMCTCRQLTCVFKLICVNCTMLGWHNIEQVANRCPECQTPGNCTIFCFQIQDSNTAPAWVGHIRCDKKIRNGFPWFAPKRYVHPMWQLLQSGDPPTSAWCHESSFTRKLH